LEVAIAPKISNGMKNGRASTMTSIPDDLKPTDNAPMDVPIRLIVALPKVRLNNKIDRENASIFRLRANGIAKIIIGNPESTQLAIAFAKPTSNKETPDRTTASSAPVE
jgi:hypothetical protein